MATARLNLFGGGGPFGANQQYVVAQLPPKPPLNVDKIAKSFLSYYYKKISSTGWNAIQDVYSANSCVIVNSEHVGNGYNMLSYLCNEGVKNAAYGKIMANWMLIGNNQILINVYGEMCFVNLFGLYSAPYRFAETFCLAPIEASTENKYHITHHSLQFGNV